MSVKEAESLGILGNTPGLGFVEPGAAFKKVSRQIIEAIKEGDLLWRKPWKDGFKLKGKTFGAQNYESQLPYRGFNAWIISLVNVNLKQNYVYFLTEKQVQERGGKLKKGAVAIPVHAFIKGEKLRKKKNGEKFLEEYFGWVDYVIYPLEHTEGVKPINRKASDPASEKVFDIIPDAQSIVENMPKAPPIKHGGDKAYYTPSGDFVQMPPQKAFKSNYAYYSTLFHELVHSTGHSKRLKRDLSGSFGSRSYAFEELIAEIGAAYLCGVCDIAYFTLNNSAAYLKSWSKKLVTELSHDPKFLFKAILAGSRAARYILADTLEKTAALSQKKKRAEQKNDPEEKTEVSKNLTDITAQEWKGYFSSRPKIIQKFAAQKSLLSREVSAIVSHFKLSPVPSTVSIYRALTNYLNGSGTKAVEVLRNHQVKSGTEAAIRDLLSLPTYKEIGFMQANVLYTQFKDDPDKRIERELDEFTERHFKKLEEKDFLESNAKGAVLLTEKGKSFIEKVKGRLHTLKAKKSGTDLFPELAGTDTPEVAIIKAYVSLHSNKVKRKQFRSILATIEKLDQDKNYPYKAVILHIRNQLDFAIAHLPDDKAALMVTIHSLDLYKALISEGLGLIPSMFSAAIGEGVKHILKNKWSGINGLAGDGFVRADQRESIKAPDTFRLPGEIGKFLQDLQAYKCSIVLTGDPHAGKTEFVMRLIDAFVSIGKRIALFSIEQGGLESKDTRAAIDRNISPENQKALFVTGEATEGLKSIKKHAADFDVVVIDSWQKLGEPSTKFDSLRHEFPNTIWIVIFQQNGEGGTRGGVAADYDSPILLKVHKVDNTFNNNFVEMKKNRGNNINLKYMMGAKKVLPMSV